MRLTTYTDYTLRVAMYLTLKYDSGELVTIDQIASAYGISHNHLTKIVHEMSEIRALLLHSCNHRYSEHRQGH